MKHQLTKDLYQAIIEYGNSQEHEYRPGEFKDKSDLIIDLLFKVDEELEKAWMYEELQS